MTHPTPAPDAPPTTPAELPEAVRDHIGYVMDAARTIGGTPAVRELMVKALEEEILKYGEERWLDGYVAPDRGGDAAAASEDRRIALADAHAAGYLAALDDVAAELAQMGGGR